MYRTILLLAGLLVCLNISAQYNWKLEKEKNGISVYLSDVKGSSYKAVKVDCTMEGTYSKLISVLCNLSRFSDWIYKNKTSKLVKQNSSLDFIYYSQTSMPFPFSNRDVVIRLRFNTDSLPKFLTISGANVSGLVPELPGMVRVPHYKAIWKVIMPTAKTIRISYILEIDPGGSLPAWLANTFADKGPYGTFSKLANELKN
jgi:hypothetical protein